MDDSFFLSYDDVAQLTGFKRKDKQVQWLREQGIKHWVNGAGEPIIAKEVLLGRRKVQEPKEFVPAALRRSSHGRDSSDDSDDE